MKKDLTKEIALIEKLISLENDEYTEKLSLILQLYNFSGGLPLQLYDLLEEIIKESYEYILENAEFVEETETYTRTVTTINWLDL